MKDFHLEMKVRNNRLLVAIREKFGTSANMAREAGISPSAISALLGMKVTPVNQSGWTGPAEEIASALGVLPSEIWPEHMREVRLKTATAEMTLDAAEVQQIVSDAADVTEMRDLLTKIGGALTPREQMLVEFIKENPAATYDEKGVLLGGVTRERARQIECKAFRKMRASAARLGVNQI